MSRNPSDTLPPALLEVQEMRLAPDVPPISVTIHEGEIVGLAGLDGQGQEAFLEALCGLQTPHAGRILVHAADGRVSAIKDFHGAVQAGIAYLPRNRKTQGILPALSVLDNFSVATLPKHGRFGWINRRAQKERLAQYRERLSMVFASPGAPITSLSGGNQQKVLLARWMAAEPRVMLLNDPTRGVDLPTRMKLYEVFREMVAASPDGRAATTLVLLSTEVEELLQLCDRVLVFRDQSIFTQLEGDRLTFSYILAGMFGRSDDA